MLLPHYLPNVRAFETFCEIENMVLWPSVTRFDNFSVTYRESSGRLLWLLVAFSQCLKALCWEVREEFEFKLPEKVAEALEMFLFFQ